MNPQHAIQSTMHLKTLITTECIGTSQSNWDILSYIGNFSLGCNETSWTPCTKTKYCGNILIFLMTSSYKIDKRDHPQACKFAKMRWELLDFLKVGFAPFLPDKGEGEAYAQ